MTVLNPHVILYDANGTAMAVADGVAIPANTRGLLVHGTDAGTARRVRVAADGSVYTLASASSVQPTSPSYSPTFVARCPAVATSNGGVMAYIFVANGSAYKVCLREVWFMNVRTAAATGVMASFTMRRFTSISSPTTVTPVALDASDSLDSSITAGYAGTLTGASTQFSGRNWSTDELSPGTADAETTEHSFQQSFAWGTHNAPMRPITVRADSGLAIQCQTNTTTGIFDVELVFTQEAA